MFLQLLAVDDLKNINSLLLVKESCVGVIGNLVLDEGGVRERVLERGGIDLLVKLL